MWTDIIENVNTEPSPHSGLGVCLQKSPIGTWTGISVGVPIVATHTLIRQAFFVCTDHERTSRNKHLFFRSQKLQGYHTSVRVLTAEDDTLRHTAEQGYTCTLPIKARYLQQARAYGTQNSNLLNVSLTMKKRKKVKGESYYEGSLQHQREKYEAENWDNIPPEEKHIRHIAKYG